MIRRWFRIPDPICLAFGHDFVDRNGKTYCQRCGQTV